MESQKIQEKKVTLVDHVENKLFEYISKRKLKVGDTIPNETELAEVLGVSRSVLREALSRLRMLGVIESRTRRGMILKEPDMFSGLERVMNPLIICDKTLFNLLGFRVALELGICSSIIDNVTSEDIEELEEIVSQSNVGHLNRYSAETERAFHSKLYDITGNGSIKQFQKIIYPVSKFIRSKFTEHIEPINEKLLRQGRLISHAELLDLIKASNKNDFREGMEIHFGMYSSLIKLQNKSPEIHNTGSIKSIIT